MGFALFDDRIDLATKAKLAKKMLATDFSEYNLEDEEFPKKLTIMRHNLSYFLGRENVVILEELFTNNTNKLLKRFNISTDFLKKDPSSWSHLDEYCKGKSIIASLKIVNDCAERGIKLVQEYHEQITKDEEQRQHLFKVMTSCIIIYKKV